MSPDLAHLARTFFGAYDESDLETVRSLLPEDAVVYVTNAAFLARISGDQISGLWMVEALPAYRDEFWS